MAIPAHQIRDATIGLVGDMTNAGYLAQMPPQCHPNTKLSSNVAVPSRHFTPEPVEILRNKMVGDTGLEPVTR